MYCEWSYSYIYFTLPSGSCTRRKLACDVLSILCTYTYTYTDAYAFNTSTCTFMYASTSCLILHTLHLTLLVMNYIVISNAFCICAVVRVVLMPIFISTYLIRNAVCICTRSRLSSIFSPLGLVLTYTYLIPNALPTCTRSRQAYTLYLVP